MNPDPLPEAAPAQRRRFPLLPVTGSIVALNIVVFVAMAALLNAGWLEATNLEPYIKYGANNAVATEDQWWRLVTSMFMHFGLLHLALNMWALLQAGSLVERLQGRILYGLTYLVSGIGGGLLSMDWHGGKMWSAGASGAIFGVYGALLGYITRDRLALPRSVLQPLTKSTVLFACYNLFYGFVSPSIDNADHIGGLVSGLALGWLTAPSPGTDRSASWGRRLGIGAAAAALIMAVGVAFAPNVDFILRDEQAWEKAVKPFADRQEALEQKLGAQVQEWLRNRSSGPDLYQLVEDKMVPFYEGLGRTVQALNLAPSKATDRRRKLFATYAGLEVEAFHHLEFAVQGDNMRELDAYTNLRREAGQAIGPTAPKADAKP